MATLTGQRIKDSYKDLLQVSNSNSGIDSTLRAVSDGEATSSLLQLSTTAVNISSAGALQYAGVAITSTAAELNILDGLTATTTELNLIDGVTATTEEINYIDGVTSNIQTQLNLKAPIAGASLTGTTSFQNLSDGTITITAFADEDDFSSNSATLLATQQSIKAYVDANVNTELIQDLVGAMFTSNTQSGITVAYEDSDGTIDLTVATQSDNNFTTTLKNKLDAIEASATADQSNAEIRTAVEAATDSNVFTDADHSKLNEIEASATADQTNAEIVAAVEAGSDSNTFTDADHGKLNAIEASADVTDTANVTSAGALMDSELASIADIKALDQSVVSGATPTFTTTNFTDASNKRLMTDAQETKLDSVESSADVTDTANVTSAGALMDSELTDLAGVKGVTISTLQPKPSEGAFANGDKTKLDAIEAGADVTDTANVTSAGALMDSELAGLAAVKATTGTFLTADQNKLDGIAVSANNYTLPLLDEDNMASDSATSVPSQQSVKAYVNSIVDGAPGTLDTLNELAAALGDDANYAASTSTAIGLRALKSNNLSDLANAGTARSNLGLGSGAVLNTAAISNGASTLATGNAIYDHITARISGLTSNAGDITSVVAGTGLSGGATSGAATLNVDAAQTQITSIGTIGTGVWQGTAIASAYLDADTAHLSTTQTFTGAKTFSDSLRILGGTKHLYIDNNDENESGVWFRDNQSSAQYGKIFFDSNGSANALNFYVQSGTPVLKLQQSTATVTGNLAVTGTVDGRDVASDGSKLDGIASGATANTGDITSVVAGSGLTGGATSGAATLNIGAGTGIDVAADAISVDVSDFMANGSNNRILTSTGTDAMNAEANLTFNGNTLVVSGDNANGIQMAADGSNTANSERIFFEGTSTSAIFQEGNDLSFRTGATAGSSSGTERFKIDNNGDLTISGGSLTLPVAEKLYFGGGNHTYISEDVDDRLRFFVGGDEFMRFTQQDAAGEIFSIYQDVYIPDSKTMHFGNGNDLKLQHTGTHSYIQASGTGNLYIQQNTADLDLILQCDDGSGGTAAYLTLDGSSTRIKIDQNMEFQDSVALKFGTSDDMRIYHDGSNSYIRQEGTGNLYIRNDIADKDIILQSDDGSGGTTAYLTLDGSTKNINIDVTTRIKKDVGDGGIFYMGADSDLALYVTGDHAVFRNYTSDGDIYLSVNDGGVAINAVQIDASDGGTAIFNHDIRIPATGKLFLDGGSNTYLTEESANTVKLYVNGDNTLTSIMNRVYINSTGANGLVINNDEGATGNSGRLFFEGTETSAIFQSGGALSFRSGATTGSSSGTQQMYISSAGLTVSGSQTIGGALTANYGAVFNETANDSDFRVESVGNANMFKVDASTNRVGIGTGSPTKELEVAGSVRITGDTIFGANNNNSKAFIKARDGYSSATTPDYTWYYNDQCGIYHPAANTIGFSASGEKMKIGTYGIHSKSSLYIEHGGSDYTPGIIFLGGSNTPGSNAYENAHIAYYDNSGTGTMLFEGKRGAMNWAFNDADETLFMMNSAGTLHCEADVVAYSTSVNSDRTLKENINPIPYGLEEVLKMNPVEYDWKEKRNKAHDIGVIAQEIEKIIPEVVQENKDLNSDKMIKSVDYSKMVAVLIKAVQEQQVQIDELKTQIGE